VAGPDSNILNENDLIPYAASEPVGNRVLVLAPHPDDEALGCGGSLRILSEAGKAIKVVFLTKGEKADPNLMDKERYSLLREKEALKALKILSIRDHEFLRIPDRELYANMDKAIELISTIVKDFKPDALYSPSSLELNPDHRATAEIAMAQRNRCGLRIVFYELTVPLRPNILVDITGVFRRKKKAVRAYKSQLRLADYVKLISALNIYRTFTLGNKSKYAEAFLVMPVD
jgi:LmbE family N-acetylglucosaminyl deacetylase